MKKIISVMLLITLVFSLTSCGKPKEIKELEKLTKALNEIGSEEGEDVFSGIVDSLDEEVFSEDFLEDYSDDYSDDELDKTPGEELSNFYSFYDNALSSFEGAVNAWETDDFAMFDASLDYFATSLHIVGMSLYDLLGIFGADEGEYREAKGNLIEYGKEYTREEDGFSPNDKKGDFYVEKGILDTSTNTLYFENYTERDGQKISRVVSEVVALSDGTFIVQTFSKPVLYDDRMEDKGTAYFMVFDANKLEVIRAVFAPDVDFTYDSIIGKGKTNVEDLAQGYTLVRKMTIVDNVASVEKY